MSDISSSEGVCPQSPVDTAFVEGGLSAESPVPASRDYKVGYGRPPRATQFKPGQSGNPKGRPRRTTDTKAILTACMTRTVKVKTANGNQTMTAFEAYVRGLQALSNKGDMAAARILLALMVRPPQLGSDAGAETEDWTAADSAALVAYQQKLLGGAGSLTPDRLQ